MNKRLFLAMALSLLVLFSWQAVISKFYPTKIAPPLPLLQGGVYHTNNQEVISPGQSQETAPAFVGASPETKPVLPEQLKTKEVSLDRFESDKLRIEFINPGARIYRVFLKDYQLNSEITGGLYSKLFENETYTLQKSKDTLQLTSTKIGHSLENGHYLTQTFNFHNNSYYIELETKYENKTSSNWTFNDNLILSNVSGNAKPMESRLFETVFLGQNTLRKNPLSLKNKYVHSEPLQGLAFRDRYSCIIISPQNFSQGRGYIEKANGLTQIGLELNNITIPANSQAVYKSLLYCGPQDVKLLRQSKLGLEEVVSYGTFDFISTALLAVLHFFHKLSQSWGLALILLSVFIFLMLYPLTLKQMRSMKQMQELQPQIEALRKNYKDNPQRLNKEIMELYRRHKANPLGGCLPMLLQIPIFFGLYQALSRSIVLKGARFLWIKDLAEPDRIWVLPNEMPFIGKEINLLPILMAIAMFFQQKLSLKTSAANPAMMEQQKMMLVIMPIMFGFIFYHFPSGLALYWFLNTLTSVLLQWKTLKTTSPSPSN